MSDQHAADEMEKLGHAAMCGNDNPYLSFYSAHPELYRTPIGSWREFYERFARTGDTILIPDRPPTIIEPRLLDQQFFSPKDEVSCNVNINYCPPFLHRHSFIKLAYVLRGEACFMMNGQSISLRRGAFALVGPNVEQALYCSHDDDIVVNLLIRLSAFSDSFMNLLSMKNALTDYLWRILYNRTENTALLYRGEEETELTDTVLDLSRELEQQKNKSNLICKSLLMIFFGTALRLHGDSLSVLSNTKRSQRCRLPDYLYYMSRHMHCTLPALAEHFGVSEGYLSRYLRRETGRTFSDLLCDFRMKRAARMLANTNFSIDMIVASVGYTDKSRFYRNFSRIYGMSPMRYRKRTMILE